MSDYSISDIDDSDLENEDIISKIRSESDRTKKMILTSEKLDEIVSGLKGLKDDDLKELLREFDDENLVYDLASRYCRIRKDFRVWSAYIEILLGNDDKMNNLQFRTIEAILNDADRFERLEDVEIDNLDKFFDKIPEERCEDSLEMIKRLYSRLLAKNCKYEPLTENRADNLQGEMQKYKFLKTFFRTQVIELLIRGSLDRREIRDVLKLDCFTTTIFDSPQGFIEKYFEKKYGGCGMSIFSFIYACSHDDYEEELKQYFKDFSEKLGENAFGRFCKFNEGKYLFKDYKRLERYVKFFEDHILERTKGVGSKDKLFSGEGIKCGKRTRGTMCELIGKVIDSSENLDLLNKLIESWK